jgi:hypothetical protein
MCRREIALWTRMMDSSLQDRWPLAWSHHSALEQSEHDTNNNARPMAGHWMY